MAGLQDWMWRKTRQRVDNMVEQLDARIGTLPKDMAGIQRQIGTSDSIYHVFRIFEREKFNQIDRWLKVRSRGIAGDTLIWGHPTLGTWGSQKWGDASTMSFILGHSGAGILGLSKLGSQASAWTTVRIIHPDNIMREWFYDSEFKDTGATTATWSVANRRIDFTDGQIAQSLTCYMDETTITQVILTATYTGNLAFYASANGGTDWEVVTSGTLYTFTNTGSELKWKAVSTGVSQLTKLEIEYVII